MKEQKNDHPYIVAVGENKGNILRYFIEVERHLLQVWNNLFDLISIRLCQDWNYIISAPGFVRFCASVRRLLQNPQDFRFEFRQMHRQCNVLRRIFHIWDERLSQKTNSTYGRCLQSSHAWYESSKWRRLKPWSHSTCAEICITLTSLIFIFREDNLCLIFSSNVIKYPKRIFPWINAI